MHITHERARESAQRLINSHFNNPDKARVSIPARSDYDDDLIIMEYINQQESGLTDKTTVHNERSEKKD